ncbi:MAG: hypothetical protein PVI06_09975 [Desulfobacterales bacterium]|jgi:CTP synthase (UTP-ammonia lyase)
MNQQVEIGIIGEFDPDLRYHIATNEALDHAANALLEYARNALSITDAEHEETALNTPTLVVSKLACSLVGKAQTIKILTGSPFHNSYGRDEVTEQFVCNYGLNPKFRDSIEKGQLKAAGVDLDGEIRAIELTDHPFFVGTLYQPQISSTPEIPHPIIVAYLLAALELQMKGK